MKALNFRALAIWICIFLFLVFLTLRLDDKIFWSWYVVFIPLWILDAAIIYHIAALIFNMCSMNSSSSPPPRKRIIQLIFYVIIFLIQTAGQVLICIKLENRSFAKYYLVMLPLWLTLLIFIIDMTRYLFCRAMPCFDKQPPKINHTRTRRYGVVIR